MTPERATEIISAAKARTTIGPWSDHLRKVMTADEIADVFKVWNQLPCFVDALQRISKGANNQ